MTLTRSLWPLLFVFLLIIMLMGIPTPVKADASRPSLSVGDRWTYNLMSSFSTGVGTLTADGTVTLSVAAEETVVIQGTTYDTFKLQISSSGNYGGFLIGTFTQTGTDYLRRTDLAEIKTHLVTNVVAGFTLTETDEVINTPPKKTYDFPLSVGKMWSLTTSVNTTTILSTNPTPQVTITSQTWTYNVQANANVAVSAGTFDTYHITSSNGTVTNDDYYSPQVGNSVKQVMTGPSGSATLTLTDYRFWPVKTSFSFSASGGPFNILARTTVNASNPRQDSSTFSFDVTGKDGTTGKANVTIPKRLNNTKIVVSVDSTPASATLSQNSTHYFVALTFTMSTHTITLTLVSENFFTSPLFLGGLAAAVLLVLAAILVMRRRKAPPPMATPAVGTPPQPPPPPTSPP